MNKNNIIALVLLAALFGWYLNTNAKQNEKVRLEAEAKKSAMVADSIAQYEAEEKARLDSVRAAEAATPVEDSSEVIDSLLQVAPRKIVVENDHFFIELDNKGARITGIVLKSLKNHEGKYPQLLEKAEQGLMGFQLDKMDFSAELFSVEAAADTLADTLHVHAATLLTFTWAKGGQSVKRTFSFEPDSWQIQQKISFEGFSPRSYKIFMTAGLSETEPPARGGLGMADYNFTELVMRHGDKVNRKMFKKAESFNDPGLEWVGVRRKYLATVLDFGSATQAAISAEPIDSESGYKPTYGYSVSEKLATDDLSFTYTILPLAYKQVKAYGRHYEEIIWSGWGFLWANQWFPAICNLSLGLLKTFYSWVGNYGIAIIMLTLMVKLITMPLLLSQQRNMKKMAEHKPAMDELRKKYSKEPQRYQQELMAYYKEKGINPLAQMFGCFPMFLQMPVFFSLFIVFSRSIELRNAPFLGWIQDLSSPDILTTAITIPFVMPAGLSLLPFIMAITTFYQTKQTMTDPNMKGMVYIMPLMMFTFSGVMPSGLVLYWIVSNLFTIVQYKLVGTGKPKPVVSVG